jgi:hypothetical protein
MTYHYRLHDVDGENVGEIHLAGLVAVGEELVFAPGRKLRVVSVVPLLEEDSRYVGLLMVEAA